MICKLSLGSTVYNLWKLRNDLKFGNDLLSEEKLLQEVSWEIRNWIVSIGQFKASHANITLCSNLGISPKVLC
jgi:hypothetical protein